VATLLIKQGADVNTIATNHITPLHLVAGNGDKEVVELLLAKGAKTGVVVTHPRDPGTPLDWAERYHHEEIADLLRQEKAE
jgi:ankyrin repeat protein